MALQQEAIKWIAGTDFMVDGFKFQNPRCTRYFLTHFHSDHTIGLYRSFNSGTVFCSRITAALLTKCMGLRSDCIQILPMHESVTVDGVEVTALDANHCPGSVMLLFKVPGQAGRPGQVILHTGDFRYHERMAQYPSLRNTLIDTIYLDTTYAYPRHTFPSQEDAIATTVRLCRKHLAEEERPLFVFGAYQIGKERAVIGAAKALGLRIHIEPRKRRILSLLDLADMHLFTPNAADADIHLGFMSEVRPPSMLRRLKEGGGQWAQVVGFRPTGWSFRKDGVHTTKQGLATVYGVPYSEHSSFDDLRACIAALRPRKIIPTVNADTKLKAANLVARFADLMDLSANRYRIDAFFRPRPAKRSKPENPTASKQNPADRASNHSVRKPDAFPSDGLDAMYPSLGKQDVAEEAETQFEDELVSEGVTEATDMEEDAGGCGFEQEGFVARQGEGFQEADFDEKGLEQDLSLAGVTGASGVGGEVRGCGFEQDPGFEELQGGQGLDCEGPEEERLSEGGTEASELRLDGGFQQDQGFEELQGVPGLDCEGPYDEVGFSEVNEEVWEGDEEEPREGLGVEGMEEDSERRGENKAEEGEIKVEQRENKAGEGFEKAEIRERKVEERREKTGGGGCQADEWEKKADVAVGGENFETDAAEPRTGIGGASGPVCEEASGRFFETEWGGGSEGQKEGNDHPGSRSSDWFGSSVTGRGGRTGQDEANPHAGRRGAESPNERAVTDSGTAFEDSDTWHDDLDTWQEGGECWEELPADRLLPTDGTACEAELRTRETSGEAEESLPGETGAARDSGSVPREPDYEGVEDCDAGADFPADENGALSTRVGQSGGREAELERESVHGDLDPATQFGRGDDCKAGAGPCGEPSGEGGQSVGLLESSECPPRTNVVSADCTVQSCEISVDILTIDSREQAYILRSIEQAKLKSDKAPRGKRKVTAPPGSRVATRSGSGVKGKRSKLVSPSVAASESASVRRTKSEGQAQGQTLIKSFFSI